MRAIDTKAAEVAMKVAAIDVIVHRLIREDQAAVRAVREDE